MSNVLQQHNVRHSCDADARWPSLPEAQLLRLDVSCTTSAARAEDNLQGDITYSY